MKNKKIVAQVSVTIDAPVKAVWSAITTPETIKQYLMGTRVTSDFQEGSDITYEGEYEGKKYHDKGKIIQSTPEKIFQSTYWSSMGGKEDKPENYNLFTYKLSESGGKTKVTLTQDNVLSEKEKEHVISNWKSVLKKLKEVLINKNVPAEL